MIFLQGPASATWVVGTLYGVNMIFYGISLFGMLSSAKSSNP